jgi:hypothetical protein
MTALALRRLYTQGGIGIFGNLDRLSGFCQTLTGLAVLLVHITSLAAGTIMLGPHSHIGKPLAVHVVRVQAGPGLGSTIRACAAVSSGCSQCTAPAHEMTAGLARPLLLEALLGNTLPFGGD